MFTEPGEDAPRRVGPYAVLARLGAGGMGEVFLGRAPDGHLAAVKTVRRELADDPVFRRRFGREIRLAGTVAHPGVARLLGGEARAEQPWLATEFVPGPTLGEAVRLAGPLPEAAVRHLGGRLAAALAAIHDVGVLHRDLKPGNILLAGDGARIIDFGIARAAGVTTMTSAGSVIGTPGYLSPEQVAGGGRVVTASDVFSLGAVLAYAACGRGPFGTGPAAVVLYRVADAEPDLDDVPPGLREVVADCLAKDPARRPDPAALTERFAPGAAPGWPSAVNARAAGYAAAAAALSEAPPEAPPAPHPATVVLPPPGSLARPRRRVRRRAPAMAAGALTAVAVLIAGALLLNSSGGGADPDDGGAAGAGGSDADDTDPEGRDPDGADPALPADMDTVPESELLSGIGEQGGPDRSGVVPQHSSQRPADWQPWTTRLSKEPLGCAADPSAIVCWLADGAHEALSTADGSLIWRTEGSGQDAEYAGVAGNFARPAGSAPAIEDGTVVFGSLETVQVRDVASGELHWELPYDHWEISPLLRAVTLVGGTVFLGGFDEVVAHELAAGADGFRWRQPLFENAGEGGMADARARAAVVESYAEGLLYTLGEHGPVALDVETGRIAARATGLGLDCLRPRHQGEQVYCSSDLAVYQGLDVLDARTLDHLGRVPFDPFGGRRDARLAAVGEDLLLAVELGGAGQLLVLHRVYGEAHQVLDFPVSTGLTRDTLVSEPRITQDRVVFADNSRLYALALDRPADDPVSVDLPGAPGDRPPIDGPPGGPWPVTAMQRGPTLLPLGGLAHVVFDEGTVISAELPAVPAAGEG